MFKSASRGYMPVVALVATLGGCAGQQITSGGLPPQAVHAEARSAQSKSWMKPGVASQKLLYVSQLFAGAVNVYTYPGLTYAGQLTGFVYPTGECTDRAGNVWITDQAASVYEYAHGGTSPINVLSTGLVQPEGCAINLETGDLAVSNLNDQVLVFHNAAGAPTTYSDPNFSHTTSLGYDNQGNLFVDGADNNSQFHYAELPAGGSTFNDITLSTAPSEPGNVQWDGKYMAVGDQASTIYRASGSNVVSSVTLSTTNLGTFYIVPSRKRVIAPEESSNLVGIFPYPAGGSSIGTVSGGLQYPVGVVLSR